MHGVDKLFISCVESVLKRLIWGYVFFFEKICILFGKLKMMPYFCRVLLKILSVWVVAAARERYLTPCKVTGWLQTSGEIRGYFFDSDMEGIKYVITVNQYAAVQSGLDVDIIDMAVYDFIRSYIQTSECVSMTDDAGVWYNVPHAVVVSHMPILGIKSERAVLTHVNRLIEAGLIVRHEGCGALRRTFYRLGAASEAMDFVPGDVMDEPRRKIPKPEKKFGVDWTTLDLPEDLSEGMREVVERWLSYKREKRQMYTPTGLRVFIKKLLDLSGGDARVAAAIVEQSMAANYAGVFPLKKDAGGGRTYEERMLEDYGRGMPLGCIITESEEERNRKYMESEGW